MSKLSGVKISPLRHSKVALFDETLYKHRHLWLLASATTVVKTVVSWLLRAAIVHCVDRQALDVGVLVAY